MSIINNNSIVACRKRLLVSGLPLNLLVVVHLVPGNNELDV